MRNKKRENEIKKRKKQALKLRKQKEFLRHKKQLETFKKLKFTKRFFDTENEKHKIRLQLIDKKFKKLNRKLSPETIAKIKKRRSFATTKIGKKLTDVKEKHIKEGRLNQIVLKYQIGKKKFEVSVIVKTKKQLKDKLKLFSKYYTYETRKNKLKVLSVERYLVKKKKK